MTNNYKLLSIGLLAVTIVACFSCENIEPEPEPDPGVLEILPKEITFQASQIKKITYQSEYDPLFGIGRVDWLSIIFEYEGREYGIHTETPPTYDSAKQVNTMIFVDTPVIFDESKPAILDSLLVSSYGEKPYLWGVIVKEFNPFIVTINRLEESNNPLPGEVDKITFMIEPGVQFNIVRNGYAWDRREYAEFYLEYPEEFPDTMNRHMQTFTKTPRYSVTFDFW